MQKIESGYFKRQIFDALKKKLLRQRSFLLLGPRQTGKSFLVSQLFDALPSHCIQLRIFLQLPSEREAFEMEPELLLRQVEAKQKNGEPVWLMVDEIQLVPRVLDVIQYLVDHKKVVMAATGSSARKLRKMGANWLPGRIDLEFLHPLSWEEGGSIKHHFTLNEYLLYGALPGLLKEQDLEARRHSLKAYTSLYLEEEIRREAEVKNLPRFAQFLRLASFESGTAPNYSKLAQQVGVTHPTIRSYYQILEDGLIVHPLPYFGKNRAAILRPPKYYFFDIGVRNAATRLDLEESFLALQFGVLFEHFIVLEIMRTVGHKAELFFWKNKTHQEVDLILTSGNKIWALEIKATSKPNHSDFKNLYAFLTVYPKAKAYLVCQVNRAEKHGEILAIPWHELYEWLDFT